MAMKSKRMNSMAREAKREGEGMKMERGEMRRSMASMSTARKGALASKNVHGKSCKGMS